MNSRPDRMDRDKMGLLPTDSLTRLLYFTQKRKIENQIREAASKQGFSGYHLHCSSSEPNDASVHENQLHIYVKDSGIHAKYLYGTPLKIISSSVAQAAVTQAFGGSDYNETFDKIKAKLNNNTPLTSNEAKIVFTIFEGNWGLVRKNLSQNQHPLLQTMDDYIVSMQRKQNSGHVNFAMADDKIEFTKTLRTFVENPTEDNWHNVRHAMHDHPRYGFSWTGMSQADYFLTVIKIQYKDKITSFDESYANNNTEAKTSWGRFVNNFGFAYYIPSVFLALYKLVQFIYHEGAREYYHYQINDLRKNMGASIDSTSSFKHKADEIINNLEAYLSEEDLNVTEEVVAYIDEIDGRINELKNLARGVQNNTTTNAIEALAGAVKQLVPRPVPLRDMSYIQLS